ncbi:MAG: AAA family ATPase [Immundisolibacteraceae bacterium]|nr:AAA family ATPase [Immundisolibacteraceae bacterium]
MVVSVSSQINFPDQDEANARPSPGASLLRPDHVYQAMGLAEDPFKITPDIDYLYASAQHVETIRQLEYAAMGGSLSVLTGEVGLGKTLICRKILNDFAATDEVKTAYLLNPPQNFGYLIANVIHDLTGVRVHTRSGNYHHLVELLYRVLLEEAERGRQVVLIIDEAHRLGAEVLEGVRLLTNLETSKQKLLSIILVGQPELDETLARRDLRQLRQRIAVRSHLQPLNRQQTREYVEHRLASQDRELTVRLTAPAHWWLYRLSSGIPRRINLLCGRAILAAFAGFAPQVRMSHVRRASREIEYGSD